DERLVDLVELIGRIHLRNRTGPGAGLCTFRVIALARPEVQRTQPDQAGLCSMRRRSVLQGVLQERVRSGITREGHVHRRRRNAGDPQRPLRADDLAAEWVRRMWGMLRLRDWHQIDEQVARFLLQLISWYRGGNAGTGVSGEAMKHPVVP